MHRLFGQKKEVAPPPTLGDAAGSINQRVEALDQKIAQLDGELRRYKEQLKKARGPAANTIKKRAMQTLQRKRMYEQQRDQLAGQAFNVEQTSFAIDSIKDTKDTMTAMKAAVVTMKKETKKLNIDEIENFQDELADMLEDMNEVSEAMGRSYGTPDVIDESELEAELAVLDDMDMDELLGDSTPEYLTPSPSLPVQPSGGVLPAAPTTLPTSPVSQQTDEYGLPIQHTI